MPTTRTPLGTGVTIGLMLLTTISDAVACQAVSDRGIHIVRRGAATAAPAPPPPGPPPPGMSPGAPPVAPGQAGSSDTMFLDRFERIGDTLRGRLDVLPEGAHIDYRVVLGPRSTVRIFESTTYAPNDPEPGSRFRWRRIVVLRDSMIVTSAAGVQRFAASAEVLPMFPGALALQELLTRRAVPNGGTADAPVFWLTSGRTFPATVRPGGSDSLVVAVFGAPLRVRVDSVGRILGGVWAGSSTNEVWVRVGPDDKMGLIKSRPDTTYRPN